MALSSLCSRRSPVSPAFFLLGSFMFFLMQIRSEVRTGEGAVPPMALSRPGSLPRFGASVGANYGPQNDQDSRSTAMQTGRMGVSLLYLHSCNFGITVEDESTQAGEIGIEDAKQAGEIGIAD